MSGFSGPSLVSIFVSGESGPHQLAALGICHITDPQPVPPRIHSPEKNSPSWQPRMPGLCSSLILTCQKTITTFSVLNNRISFGVVVRSKGKRLSQIISNVDLWTIFLLNPPKTFQEYSPPSIIF